MNFAILFSSLAIFPYYSEPSWHQHCQTKKVIRQIAFKTSQIKIFFKYLSQKGQFRHKEKNNNSKGGHLKQIKERGVIAQKSSMVLLENRA